IVFDDLRSGEPIRVYEKGIRSEIDQAKSFGEHRLFMRDGDIISPRVTPSEPLRNQMAEFIRCIDEGESPITGGAEGLANCRTLSGIEESISREGSRVSMDLTSSASLPTQAMVTSSSVDLTGQYASSISTR